MARKIYKSGILCNDNQLLSIYSMHSVLNVRIQDLLDLCTVTRWIASFGGFMNRKGDGNPGMITVWRGWMRIMDGAEIYEMMHLK